MRAEVTKEFDDSTVAKILELVENASSKKAHVENFITRFARYYTPAVVIGAVVLAVIPPLFLGQSWAEWVRRACTFLVISCPCALVISVPMSFFSGIGAASKKAGFMVKEIVALETMAKLHTVVFDKTGTLTKGEFKVAEIHSVDGDEKKQSMVLELAALAESYSDHPISRSIRDALVIVKGKNFYGFYFTEVKMAGSTYGNIFKITTWGESHGKAVGVVVDGCPAGVPLCEEDIQFFLDRRKPGQSAYTTQRNEDDKVEILSGIFEGKTTGTPISLVVHNKDHHSADYSQIAECYRPGHADYTFGEGYGSTRVYRACGRFSRVAKL